MTPAWRSGEVQERLQYTKISNRSPTVKIDSHQLLNPCLVFGPSVWAQANRPFRIKPCQLRPCASLSTVPCSQGFADFSTLQKAQMDRVSSLLTEPEGMR